MKMFDVVRLIGDLPEDGLRAGAEGTIVEVHEKPEPAYEVEFADGTTVAVKPELLAPR
jgi:3-deoxy-D-arabino-heptulosonate 7-phosphate (DAHP) synthase